ncbi:MAG: hypothetical protein SFV18_14115 [Bryobacteraceae bacterium]|nr:hypothetical protein [Bryobacteraceae bacterium]
MPEPTIPPPNEHLGHRPFSFYPAIVGIEHNEWRYKRSTWSEVLVVNTKTNDELWVPRRFLGELAKIEEPVMIWGLVKEMEYRAGALVPHIRRVIEMPRAVNDIPRSVGGGNEPAAPSPGPAPVVGIRLESNEFRIGRLIGAVLLIGIAAAAVLVGVYRNLSTGKGVTYKTVLQASLGLTSQDDYYAVVRKLGAPKADRWRDDSGEVQYRLLEYPDKFVVLMGRDRNTAVYIGALDRAWKPVDSVKLPGGAQSYSMLAQLPKF